MLILAGPRPDLDECAALKHWITDFSWHAPERLASSSRRPKKSRYVFEIYQEAPEVKRLQESRCASSLPTNCCRLHVSQQSIKLLKAFEINSEIKNSDLFKKGNIQIANILVQSPALLFSIPVLLNISIY